MYTVFHIYIRPKFVKSGMIIFYQILIVCGLERKCDCLKSVLLLYSYLVAAVYCCVNCNGKEKQEGVLRFNKKKCWVLKMTFVLYLIRMDEFLLAKKNRGKEEKGKKGTGGNRKIMEKLCLSCTS